MASGHTAVPRAGDIDVIAFIFLVEDNGIGFGVGSEHMPEYKIAALGCRIFGAVEQSFVIRGPGNRIDALGCVGQQFAGAQILDMQPVLAEADVVRRVGEQAVVVTDRELAQRHELFSLSQFIHVEDDFFSRSQGAFLSA